MVVLKKGVVVYHSSCIRGKVTKILTSRSDQSGGKCVLEEFHVSFDDRLPGNGRRIAVFREPDINRKIFFSLNKAKRARYAVYNSLNKITKTELIALKRKHRFDDEIFNNWSRVYKFKNEYGLKYGFHDKDTLFLRYYHPKYKYHSSILNPEFDDYDRRILNVKENNVDDICYFANLLNALLAENIYICLVPSSSPNRRTGMYLIAKAIVYSNRVDTIDCLVRTEPIERKALGGNRDMSVDLDSLGIYRDELIQGKEILLLDDILTSGNSLEACSQILMNHGATKVRRLVLGKTIRRQGQ